MTVLAATDLSSGSRAAIRYAAMVARARSETLVLMHGLYMPRDESSWAYFVERAQRNEAQIKGRVLEDLEEIFAEAVPEEGQPRHVEFVFERGRPSEAIEEVADQKQADLVVVGGVEERAVASYFLGGTAEEVIRTCERPTLVVPADHLSPRCRTVLAGTDFSAASRASVLYAARWAKLFDARLIVAHVVDEPRGFLGWPDDVDSEDARERGRKRLVEWMEDLDVDAEDLPEVTRLVRGGRPHETLADIVEDRDVDLAVMGTHGQRGWKRYFVGSNTLKLLRLLPCPVAAVR